MSGLDFGTTQAGADITELSAQLMWVKYDIEFAANISKHFLAQSLSENSKQCLRQYKVCVEAEKLGKVLIVECTKIDKRSLIESERWTKFNKYNRTH